MSIHPELRASLKYHADRFLPVARTHGRRWREFLATQDEDAWDAHLLHLGERIVRFNNAKEDARREVSFCEKKTGRCGCDGCVEMGILRAAEEGSRDHQRAQPGSWAPAWMRAASAYHANWLTKQKEARP